MPHASSPWFQCFHALRIKGFANAESISEVAGLNVELVEGHLVDLRNREWALFRENRGLWQLTPTGKEEHSVALGHDVPDAVIQTLNGDYQAFLLLNETFKLICTDWQLRDGEPNDHMEAEYDDEVLSRLDGLHLEAIPVVTSMGSALDRLSPYPNRLVGAQQRLKQGNPKMLTGVMCNSYHDVWMELHEDLLLTQRINRRTEGSF